MGRPPTLPATLKDGFYIDVRNKGAASGVKIWSNNSEAMLATAAEYKRSKDVLILGEHKSGKWVTEQPSNGKSKSKKKLTKVKS
jgi:hypothetical protein